MPNFRRNEIMTGIDHKKENAAMSIARAVIQVRDQTVDVMATILVGTERDQLYEQFKAAGSNFVKYEKNTSRVIPVIRLIPVAAGVTQ